MQNTKSRKRPLFEVAIVICNGIGRSNREKEDSHEAIGSLEQKVGGRRVKGWGEKRDRNIDNIDKSNE